MFRTLRKVILSCCCLCYLTVGLAQEDAWFFFRANDSLFEPSFKTAEGLLIYDGSDQRLKNVLDRYRIKTFKKTYRNARQQHLKQTFFVIADRETLVDDLLKEAPHLFHFGEVIASEDKKIFEPNDYGLSSTIGDSKGFQVNLDYYDYLEVPKAWYYTIGSPNTKIGISDGTVDSISPDFKYKTTVIKKSSLSNAHGSGVASIAAAQGDDGFGIPGICYDCEIYSTRYGDYQQLSQLLELSQLGVRVINCSWVGSRYYETAQAVIDEMYENGTVIVAGAGNKGFNATRGERLYYPASYDKVISISAGMYKHALPEDNLILGKDGLYYGENIRGYISRTMGYRDRKRNIGPTDNFGESTGTLNEHVDLLAPTVGVFQYGKYILEGKTDEYLTYQATSASTPFVTGTIGLMLSLYPCIPTSSIEPILKLTCYTIDDIDANKRWKGLYGAGMIRTGAAVEAVFKLYNKSESITFEDHHFSRWKFPLEALSEEVRFQNISFTEDAQLDIIARNQIVLSAGTTLAPNANGSSRLSIDTSLTAQCDLQLRDPAILNDDK
ncbi:MAG: S8/S53 family peptidase [Flavobacteriaceae bacterium]|nr:S8/S53 family peptidase [Flavobacteriaceae bacterium]